VTRAQTPVLLVLTAVQLACLGRQVTFDHLRGADRVEVRTIHDGRVTTIRDPAVISAAQAAVARHDMGWDSPRSGAPAPMIQVSFYRGDLLLGGYGVGKDFLTTDQGGASLSRSIVPEEAEQITRLLRVSLPNRRE